MPGEFIRTFTEVHVLPITLYSSPYIVPGLLKLHFDLLKCSIKLISLSQLENSISERHIKAFSDFAGRMRTYRRQSYKLLPSKTTPHRNSILPALSQLLVDRDGLLFTRAVLIRIIFPLSRLNHSSNFYSLNEIDLYIC